MLYLQKLHHGRTKVCSVRVQICFCICVVLCFGWFVFGFVTSLDLSAVGSAHIGPCDIAWFFCISVQSSRQLCIALHSQEVVAASQWLSLPLKFTPLHNGSHEGNEVWLCEGNDKGWIVEVHRHWAWHEDQGLLQHLDSLVTVAAKEVKKTGVFTIPGLCRIKTRSKPATKACTKMIFGKETKVKAKPAKTVVKAFPAAALKQQI